MIGLHVQMFEQEAIAHSVVSSRQVPHEHRGKFDQHGEGDLKRMSNSFPIFQSFQFMLCYLLHLKQL